MKTLSLPLTLALAMSGAVLMAVPARAAYCGIPDDINPIVKLTIATYPKVTHSSKAIGPNSIKTVSVNGTYAYSVTDTGSQRTTFYWEKPTGTWGLKTVNHAPADWPKPVQAFFGGDDDCNNPAWKKQ